MNYGGLLTWTTGRPSMNELVWVCKRFNEVVQRLEDQYGARNLDEHSRESITFAIREVFVRVSASSTDDADKWFTEFVRGEVFVLQYGRMYTIDWDELYVEKVRINLIASPEE